MARKGVKTSKMDITSIVGELEAEIGRLTQVRDLLLNNNGTQRRAVKPKLGRPKKTEFSPEARKRMSDAQRARWATQKGEQRTNSVVKKRKLSPKMLKTMRENAAKARATLAANRKKAAATL